jgi:hypothetical protein
MIRFSLILFEGCYSLCSLAPTAPAGKMGNYDPIRATKSASWFLLRRAGVQINMVQGRCCTLIIHGFFFFLASAHSPPRFGFPMGFSSFSRLAVFSLGLPVGLHLGNFAAGITTISLSPITAAANIKKQITTIAFYLS